LDDNDFVEQSLVKAEKKSQASNSLDQIIKAVATVYTIPLSRLSEPGQKREVSEARAMAALLTLETSNLTCTDLAAVFHRDFTEPGLANTSLFSGVNPFALRK